MGNATSEKDFLEDLLEKQLYLVNLGDRIGDCTHLVSSGFWWKVSCIFTCQAAPLLNLQQQHQFLKEDNTLRSPVWRCQAMVQGSACPGLGYVLDTKVTPFSGASFQTFLPNFSPTCGAGTTRGKVKGPSSLASRCRGAPQPKPCPRAVCSSGSEHHLHNK